MSTAAVGPSHVSPAPSHEVPDSVAASRTDRRAEVQRAVDRVLGGQSPVASSVPAERGDVEGLLRALSPDLLVAAVQIGARDAQASGASESVRGAQARGELSELERQDAMAQAARAAKKARRLLGLKRFLGKLVKAVAVAAAAAATVVTGGAASGVALAGAALVVGADLVAKACEKMGLVDGKAASRLAMGLRLTGALMSAGAGLAATAGTQAGAGLTKGLRAALDATRAIAQTAEGGVAIGQGVAEGNRQGHLAKAEDARASSGAAAADMEAAVQALRDVLATFDRVQARLRATQTAQDEARRAALQQRV
jgi:hypothetical protein